MDGKQFWNKVDALLRRNNITVTELASLIGQSRNTLFVQRARATIPKIDQIKRMDYDHRKPERILSQLQPIRDVLEKRRGDPKASS